MTKHVLTEKQWSYLNALQKADWFSEYETTDAEGMTDEDWEVFVDDLNWAMDAMDSVLKSAFDRYSLNTEVHYALGAVRYEWITSCNKGIVKAAQNLIEPKAREEEVKGLDHLYVLFKEHSNYVRFKQNYSTILSLNKQFPEKYFLTLSTGIVMHGRHIAPWTVLGRRYRHSPGGTVTMGEDGSLFEDGKRLTIPVDTIPDVDAQIAKFTSAIEKANPEKEIRFHRDFDEECAYQVASEYDYDTDEERFVDRFCFWKTRSHDGNLFVLT